MKRIFDITVVLLTAAVWLPLIAGVALVVRIALGAPVFFVQERAGLKGKPFKLIKYSRKESDRFSRRENGKTTTSLGPGGIEHDKKVQDSWKATAACPGRPRNHGQGTRGSAK